MRKAQVSSEYLIIVGFVVGITIPLMLVYFTFTNDINDQIVATQVDQIARSIVDAADTVYYLGEPSQTSLRVYLPVNIDDAFLNNKALIYKVKSKAGVSDIAYVSAANLTGSLPVSAGVHVVTVKAEENGVVVSYD